MRAVWSSERAVWSAERERELSGAQRERERERERAVWSAERAIKSTGGADTSGWLPRGCYDWCFVRAGTGRLVTTAATAGGLRLVFRAGWLGHAVYGLLVTPCGDGGLFTAGWLRLMYLWSRGAGMGRATLRNIMLILWLYVSVNFFKS